MAPSGDEPDAVTGGARAAVSGHEPDPATAESHLRDLAAVMPGAFFRFRVTPAGEYRLDFMTEGIRGLTGLSRSVDLTDFNEWASRIPAGYADRFLESIERSRRELTTWLHEWPMDAPAGRIWLQGISEPHPERDGSIVWNGLLLDVTEGKQAAAELNRVETDYRSIFENTTEGIFRSSRDGRLLDANWPLVRMHGCGSKAELIDAVDDLATAWYVHPGERDRILAILDRHGYIEGFEAELYRVGTGERFWAQENSRAIRDADGNLLYYQGTIRDITDEHRARRLSDRRGELLELIARGESLTMILYEIVGTVEAYRPSITAAVLRLSDGLIGVEAAPGLSNACIEALDGASPPAIGGVVAAAVQAAGPCRHSTRAKESRAGERLGPALEAGGYGEALVMPVHSPEGSVLGLLAAFAATPDQVDAGLRGLLHEMTQIIAIALEQHQLTARLVEQAQYDALTGLPNRVLLADRMQQLMLDAGRNEHPLGVLLLDLDEFKLINDTLGHAAGDAVLRDVADRIRHCVRSTDTVARFGGDEFVVVVSPEEATRVTDVAERILTALTDTVRIRDTEVTVRPSIGIGLFPQDGLTMDSLLQAADTAMYAAKRSGKNQYRFFDESMNRAVSHRMRIETELRSALDQGQLVMYYQPRVHLATGRVLGAEALIRWQHPERGLILPAEFVPVAEQSALMGEIDQYVLTSVARQVAAWQAAGHVLQVSLNLSARELERPGFGHRIAQLLSDYGVDAAGVEIELIESMIMQDFEHAVRQLRDLREQVPGIRIAVDDFGTGHSSLQYLAQLPIDTLKIARPFVADLTRPEAEATARAIARTIVELGDNLGLRVVAEGIEEAAQVDLLRALGCNEGQGFRFSHALPASAFEALFAGGRGDAPG